MLDTPYLHHKASLDMKTQFWEDIKLNILGYYDQIVNLLPKLGMCLIVAFIGWLLFRIVRRLLYSKLYMLLEDKLIAKFIIRVVKFTMIIIVFLICLKVIGLGKVATGIWGTAGVGAFIIGFAFKDIGEHFLAGFILAFNRPFRIGDTIEINGQRGKVIELNMRNTHIKTFSGKDVYIPNGIVIKNALTNDTIDGFIRNQFSIEIEKDADLALASDVILQELQKINGILSDEKSSSVWIDDITGNKVRLLVFYWLDTFDKSVDGGLVRRKAIRSSLQALRNAEIDIPGQVVHMITD